MSRVPESPTELRARALRLLAKREHSRAELTGKLAPAAAAGTALVALLDSLERNRQLSDERFAEERARQLARKYGAARIRHELAVRGVPKNLIERVTPSDELARAREVLRRKYRAAAETREERARRARFLHARGFSSETIRRALGSEFAEG